MANRQNYMTEPTSEITSINWRVVKPLSASIIWIFTGRTDPLNVRVRTSQIYVIVCRLCSKYCAITFLVKIELQNCHCIVAS